MLLYKLGRFLQMFGMLVMPAGMVGNIVDPARVSIGMSLAVAAAGIGTFCLGWLLQQASRPE
jgi:hypothetical protein